MSASGQLRPGVAEAEVSTNSELRMSNPTGLASLSVGALLPPGLCLETLVADLRVMIYGSDAMPLANLRVATTNNPMADTFLSSDAVDGD